MKIFLDTNAILDWALDRQYAQTQSATLIIESVIKGDGKAYISSGSVYTLTYILEKNNTVKKQDWSFFETFAFFKLKI